MGRNAALWSWDADRREKDRLPRSPVTPSSGIKLPKCDPVYKADDHPRGGALGMVMKACPKWTSCRCSRTKPSKKSL